MGWQTGSKMTWVLSILAKLPGKLSQGNWDDRVVGNMACKALMGESWVSSSCNTI